MKRKSISILLVFITAITLFSIMLFNSCEGPAGVAGEDANETCIQCHNEDTRVLAAITQASNSLHQNGTSFERNGTDCAVCHTHQGFLEHLNTGSMSTTADISNPLPANCRTCHFIHENYDTTDFALRATEAVTLQINNVVVDLGTGNACISCHQPRIPDPMPVAGGGNVSITSNRWGPHHGTQSTILYGTGGYELAGSMSYPSAGSHAHTGSGCNGCHMADAFGAFAGGHSFNMTYEYHGSETDHVVSCESCHSGIEDFDWHGAPTEIAALAEELKTALIDAGYLNASTGLLNASSSTPLVVTADEAGAILNFLLYEEDGSHGVHNPVYAKALLQNSLEVFN